MLKKYITMFCHYHEFLVKSYYS